MKSKKKIKLATVNVIEMGKGLVDAIHSFADTKDGNKAAVKVFVKCIREHCQGELISEENIQEAIDNGHWADLSGDEIILCHSKR